MRLRYHRQDISEIIRGKDVISASRQTPLGMIPIPGDLGLDVGVRTLPREVPPMYIRRLEKLRMPAFLMTEGVRGGDWMGFRKSEKSPRALLRTYKY
jgi:hypothetical protein